MGCKKCREHLGQGSTGGEHGIAYHQDLAVERRRCDRVYPDLESAVRFIGVIPARRDEGLLRAVKDVSHTLVHGQTCPQDGGQHRLFSQAIYRCVSQGCVDLGSSIPHGFAHLDGHGTPQPLQVEPKPQRVLLDARIAQLRYKFIDYTVGLR